MKTNLNMEDSLSPADRERLQGYLDDVASDYDVTKEQREAASEDMRFINVDGGMWEDFLEDDFDEDRVKLELDLVSNFLQRFIGEWNLNRIGVEYKPDDSGTTDDDAELLNGIYRFDFRKASGKLATDNAVDEVATCGVGAFKLSTVFVDEEDPENDDQRVEWRPIHNANISVIWDRSAKRIDKNDARRVNVLEQYTDESFQQEFPGQKPVSALTPDDRRYLNRESGDAPNIFVSTRYEIKKRKVEMFIYNNLQASKVEAYTAEDHEAIKAELKADKLRVFVRRRKITQQIVEKTVFSGVNILEKTRRIAGKWIPIIPFYAHRSFVDGQEYYRGLVRKLKDAARLFNMQVSQLAENAASGGQEVPIFDPEQMENEEIQALWSDKNNQPYLLAGSLRDDAGNILQSGPIAYSKPAVLDQSTTTLLGIVPQFIQDVTGGAPQDTLNTDMSGKAIQALIKRENMNTQPVMDNISNAIVWSGTVYQSIAAEIYNSKRQMRTIGKDGTESQVQMLASVVDEETGKMIESNDLQGRKFQAYADAGQQYDTMQEQTVEDLKGMLEVMTNIPGGEQYLPVMTAVLLDNISGVGLDPLKKFNRNIMLTMGLIKPETPEEQEAVEQAQLPKEDPQSELVKAAAMQQEAEARSLDASSLQKTADAQKKVAETAKIESEIGTERAKISLDAINKRASEGLQ